MRECFNYLLGIPKLPLLTNLDYFSRERSSCVILPLSVQGDVFFLLLKTEVKPIWGGTLPQSEFKHFFSHSPFSLLFFFSSSLIHHPLPTPFHHSSVSSSKWEISQGLTASCSPCTCSPHPTLAGDLGTKQPPQHPACTELPKSLPQPQGSRSFAHRESLCMMFLHYNVPINELDVDLMFFLSFPFFCFFFLVVLVGHLGCSSSAPSFCVAISKIHFTPLFLNQISHMCY